MRTSELIGPALDWAVAKCEGLTPTLHKNPYGYWVMPNIPGNYSRDWSQGGPIIEREGMDITPSNRHGWIISTKQGISTGPTLLIAAMRCYVSGKLGEEVEIPEELR